MLTVQTRRANTPQLPVKGYFIREESNSFLLNLISFSWIALGTMALMQCVFFPGMVNLTCISHVALGWLLITCIFMQTRIVKNYPLSSFLIIGFTCTQLYFPLIFTTLEGKSLINNLQMPIEVFTHSSLTLIVLSTVHALYRRWSWKFFSRPAKGPALLSKLQFFKAPSDMQVWLMGLLGLAAMFYSSFVLKADGTNEVGVMGKIVDGFMAFTYAPYFIPFGILYGKKGTDMKSIGMKLLIFTLILLIISIGRNSRGAFMFGFTSLGFAFGLGLMLGIIRTKLLTLRNALIGILGVWLLTGPFADLGTAMVLVRYQRQDVSRSELLNLTLEAYQDKAAIEKYLRDNKERETDWDEKYLDNIFLARFCNIKFNDISITLASQLEKENTGMRDYTIDRIWAVFPQPILNVLKPDLNKDEVIGMSYGDYLRYLISKSPILLGSFVSGHFAGTGMAAFGWWYLVILGIAILPAYFLIDLLHVKKFITPHPGLRADSLQRRFSLCALLNITSTFQFLPTESIGNIFQFVVRGWLQMLVLYFVLFQLTQIIGNVVTPIANFFTRRS